MRRFPTWHLSIHDDGLAVLQTAPTDTSLACHPLPNRSGVILGRIFPSNFENGDRDWLWQLPDTKLDALLKSQGRTMLDDIWGTYVAFLHDRETGSSYVIRDCSGRIPCYRLRYERVDILFSDIADLHCLCLPPFSINFNYLAAFVRSSQLQIRASGLNEISELLAGDCFAVHRDSKSQYSLWSPLRIFATDPIESFDVAVNLVRTTTRRCIDAWASVYDDILLNLSGGLDSTILLHCVRQSNYPINVTCINRYGAKVGEDERRYARLAASASMVHLIEQPFFSEAASIDATLFRIAPTPKPTIPGVFGVLDIAFLTGITKKLNVTSVWTGEGGDHLFMETAAPVGAQDYLALAPFKGGLLRAVRDSARVSNQPYWFVVRDLVSRKKSSQSMASRGDVEPGFLTQDARSNVSLKDMCHPWQLDAAHLSPGRQLQVAYLSEILNRHTPFSGMETAHEHHPFLSQPLIEACLRIPSYLHLHGGIKRAVERAAFRSCIPDAIWRREQKGQSTFSVLETVHRSRAFIRELIMDGSLVRQKIIDDQAIDPFLTLSRPIGIDALFPLLSCIAAEIWLQTWQTSGLRTTAR